MNRYIKLLLLFLSINLNASEHVNVLIYHHVAENTPPSTTISVETFIEHLDQISANQFNVVDLEWAISQIRAGKPIPDRSVAITFDDGFADIYHNAFPLLKERNLPFTLFVATDAIDQKKKGMMSWEMIREMKANGAIIANHTTDHDYLVRKDSLDSEWLDSVWDNILRAQNRIEEEIGEAPNWLAYPYGEYNNDLKHRLLENNWIGFGQQSGGIAIFSDFQALPRFPAAGIYSSWKSLNVKLASKPLPIDYMSLPDPIIDDINPPLLQASLLNELPRQSELACFIEGNNYSPAWLSKVSFLVQANKPLPKGRSRYNCTMPANKGYYWLSLQWLNWK